MKRLITIVVAKQALWQIPLARIVALSVTASNADAVVTVRKERSRVIIESRKCLGTALSCFLIKAFLSRSCFTKSSERSNSSWAMSRALFVSTFSF